VLYVIIKSYATKHALIIIAIGLLIQVADTSSGWKHLRQKMMQTSSSSMGTPLRDPFWEQAAGRYENIVRIPTQDQWMVAFPTEWDIFASYAQQHGMGTNSVFLSRMDDNKFQKSHAQQKDLLITGNYDPKTLYILERDKVVPALEHLSDQKDLLARVDGYNVLAPGWFSCKTCVAPSMVLSKNLLNLQLGQDIIFSKAGYGQYYLSHSGWAWPEDWGVWSIAPSASLTLPVSLANKNAQMLIIKVRAFIAPTHPTQRFEIWVNGKHKQDEVIKQGPDNLLKLPLSKVELASPNLEIELKLSNPIRPKDVGVGDDKRLLGLGIESVIFY
jgi:hypothetical protein